MKFTIKRNKTDKAMIEFWFYHSNQQYLACVMHEDCLDDFNIQLALEDENEVEINMTLVENYA